MLSEDTPLVEGGARRKMLGVAGLAMCGAAALGLAAAGAVGGARPTALTNFKLPPYPQDNFSWKNEAPGNPPCDTGGCAFRDKAFTVDNWDQLCIQHCGDIDAMLEAVNDRQREGVMLAQGGRMQALTGMQPAEAGQLSTAGVNLDRWGLAEHEMPEQEANAEEDHKDDNFVVKGWNSFWDSGRRLRNKGVNVDASPGLGGEYHPTDGAVLVRNGMVVDSWPWDGRPRRSGASPDGNLEGVHVSGWDGEAKAW
mmetsp:Transcript_28548/g.55699  ORF Transcript_28548/g.55699 Transcript_28548/m.55699 type:complete len:253 (-) Transcript_28548:82-840(-)